MARSLLDHDQPLEERSFRLHSGDGDVDEHGRVIGSAHSQAICDGDSTSDNGTEDQPDRMHAVTHDVGSLLPSELTFSLPMPHIYAGMVSAFMGRVVRILVKLDTWPVDITKVPPHVVSGSTCAVQNTSSIITAIAADEKAVIIEVHKGYAKPVGIEGPFVEVVGQVERNGTIRLISHSEFRADVDVRMVKAMVDAMHAHSSIFF